MLYPGLKDCSMLSMYFYKSRVHYNVDTFTMTTRASGKLQLVHSHSSRADRQKDRHAERGRTFYCCYSTIEAW